MKACLKSCLFILIILLSVSCNKNKNEEKPQIVSDIIEPEIAPAAEFIEETEEIENINDYIINLFAERVPGANSWVKDDSLKSDVTSLDFIKTAQGYYIQQAKKRYFYGRRPEILALSVENDVVYVREVDFINDQIIRRNEIRLDFDGVTYSFNNPGSVNNNKLEIQNGNIQIIYPAVPGSFENETWDYSAPYTFAGTFDSPLSDNVQKLTAGHLTAFAGEYIFETFVSIENSDPYIKESLFSNKTIKVEYVQDKKCLAMESGILDILGIEMDFLYFSETTDEEPFFWQYGESAGYSEILLYFYEGGIILLHDSVAGSGGGYDVDIKKYGVFFRKKI